MKNKYKVVIIGAGSGGLPTAAKLSGELKAGDIAIIDPSDKHYYQPYWTLAGAGLAMKEVTEKPTRDYIPSGVDWIKEKVIKIEPEAKVLTLKSGAKISFDFLVVATGLKLDWGKIAGLEGNLGKNGIVSIYEYDQVDACAEAINTFKGGSAIFVMPPTPIKCAGAPQKIMYLAEEIFRKTGVRAKTKVYFVTNGKAMFGIPFFAQALAKIVKERGIEPVYQRRLIGVDAFNKVAIFMATDDQGKMTEEKRRYDLLHVVPSMSAPVLIEEAGLAFTEGEHKGWMAVDKHTLQHLKYKNIYGIGDVTGVPNSKTGAAIRKQYPVVVANLLQTMKGKQPTHKYDGYSSCPLTTENGKVMLAEFGYDGKLMPTFPFNPAVPSRFYWFLKKTVLPLMYWHAMLKGRA